MVAPYSQNAAILLKIQGLKTVPKLLRYEL